jgi:hypothetical protein
MPPPPMTMTGPPPRVSGPPPMMAPPPSGTGGLRPMTAGPRR